MSDTSRVKKFTRRRYYGFMERTTAGMVAVPCGIEPVKIGSAACTGACEYFCGHHKEEQYVVCSKKPELLDALEDIMEDAPGCYHDNRDKARAAIKKAYGETP